MNPVLRRIREVIEESGQSQNALARAGVGTQGAISNWFTDDRADPKCSLVARLVKELGVNGHWLLTGQGEKWTLEKGGDAVKAAGVAEGLALAEATIHKLREAVTSGGATEADAAVRERAARDHRIARTVETGQPQPRPAERKSGRG